MTGELAKSGFTPSGVQAMDPMEFGSVGVECSINDTCDEKRVATKRVTLLNLHFTNRERELWYGNSESP